MVRSLSIDPMPLRAIFLAVAKKERHYPAAAATEAQQGRSVA
jgi:hypothetical protein